MLSQNQIRLRLPLHATRMADAYNAHLFEDPERRSQLQLIGDEYVPAPTPQAYEPVARKVIDQINQRQPLREPNAVAQERLRSTRRAASVAAAQIKMAGQLVAVAYRKSGGAEDSLVPYLIEHAKNIIREVMRTSPDVLRSRAVKDSMSHVPPEFAQFLSQAHAAQQAKASREILSDALSDAIRREESRQHMAMAA